MTYDELVAAITRYTRDDDPENLALQIPKIVSRAEDRIGRAVKMPSEIATATNTTTIHAEEYFITKPTDWRSPHSFRLTPLAGGKPIMLQFRRRDYCDDYWPDKSVTGTPRFYCEFSADALMVVAPLDASYNAEMSYRRFIAGLSSTTQTTWVSLQLPELLLKACLKEAAVFHRNWTAIEALEKEFQALLADQQTHAALQMHDSMSQVM